MYNSEAVRRNLEMLDDDSEPALPGDDDKVIQFPGSHDPYEDDDEEDFDEEDGFAARGRFILRRDPKKRGKVQIIGEIDEDVLIHSQELWIGDIALVPDSRYYSHKHRKRVDLVTMVEKGGLNKKVWRKLVD